MRLAWHNIAYDRVRFAVTVAGIMCAVFLMVFQGSILLGFLRASSKIIDSTDADIWITGRGAPCFEFPVAIERRLAEIAYSVPGVAATSRICTRQAQFRKTDGEHQLVVMIGADSRVGADFPIPRNVIGPSARDPEALLIDSSNARLLNVGRVPLDVEVNDRRARVIGETTGFSSFLGSPYVFASYADAARFIGLEPDETMFVLVRVQNGAAVRDVVDGLKARLPNVDVWTRDEFSRKSRWYWISQTGAGGAILLAALLGFLIGLAIVSQATYATTMENIEEYATLKALGASRGFIAGVIVAQSTICGGCGYVLGLVITAPAVRMALSTIPWIVTPPWLAGVVLVPTIGMCVLASIISVRTALSVDPARVFRA
jgi:putative ABC transport system permease protein